MIHELKRPFIQAFFSHLLLAVAALMMVIQTKTLLTTANTSFFFEPAVMVAAFCIYRLAYYGISWPIKKVKWSTYKELPFFLVILIAIFSFLQPLEKAGLLASAIMALAYMMEVGKWKGIRSLPVLKSIWVALVWTIITAAIPLVQHLDLDATLLIVERFLFLLSICIIYNLRDTEADSMLGIRTIPHKIGILKTKQLTIFILALDGLIVYLHNYSFPFYIAINCSLIITALIILTAREGGRPVFYSLAVDATMIIQSLLVLSAASFL